MCVLMSVYTSVCRVRGVSIINLMIVLVCCSARESGVAVRGLGGAGWYSRGMGGEFAAGSELHHSERNENIGAVCSFS